jgi:hypothetical protein
MSTPTDPAQYLGEPGIDLHNAVVMFAAACRFSPTTPVSPDASVRLGAEIRAYALDAVQRALAAQQQHPTIEQCRAAGRGPENGPGLPYNVGGLPDTPEERARFEAYMQGHCWEAGPYNEAERSYSFSITRCLYGVWRDRGALAIAQQEPGK